ncbi:hypothetical protein DVH24_003634 [Malus domestica]|uniref:Prolamin-like domain-containing protein n=1 Tax=Malus domestica TaxID=3750 RepID=A0A498IIF1_MALDO|nr:hypothetical protein DVH24_003634 [Malus domestica]
MARSNIYITILLVVIATSTMILPGLATLAPSPDFITVKCGKEIHDAIFQPRDSDQVSLPCCRRLQKMGHDYHKALVDRALKLLFLKSRNCRLRSIVGIFGESDTVKYKGREKLVRIVFAQGIDITALRARLREDGEFEPEINITIDCKNEIFNSTIQAEVKKLSVDCCRELLTSGESCRKLLDEDRRIWDGCFTWFPATH